MSFHKFRVAPIDTKPAGGAGLQFLRRRPPQMKGVCVVTHRIELEKLDARNWRLWHAGASLGVTAQPLYGAARMLLEMRLARPSDVVEIVTVNANGDDDVLGRTVVGAGARLAMRA